MSNEIRVNGTLQVTNGNLSYQSKPTSFLDNQSVANGPAPGTITATLAGTLVNLSQLAKPGYCWFQNLDSTNTVEVGLAIGGFFYPFFRLGPGKFLPGMQLSEYFGEDVGTGTSGTAFTPGVAQMMIKAITAPCDVRVDCFDS